VFVNYLVLGILDLHVYLIINLFYHEYLMLVLLYLEIAVLLIYYVQPFLLFLRRLFVCAKIHLEVVVVVAAVMDYFLHTLSSPFVYAFRF
jgi:hypothetical protein